MVTETKSKPIELRRVSVEWPCEQTCDAKLSVAKSIHVDSAPTRTGERQQTIIRTKTGDETTIISVNGSVVTLDTTSITYNPSAESGMGSARTISVTDADLANQVRAAARKFATAGGKSGALPADQIEPLAAMVQKTADTIKKADARNR